MYVRPRAPIDRGRREGRGLSRPSSIEAARLHLCAVINGYVDMYGARMAAAAARRRRRPRTQCRFERQVKFRAAEIKRGGSALITATQSKIAPLCRSSQKNTEQLRTRFVLSPRVCARILRIIVWHSSACISSILVLDISLLKFIISLPSVRRRAPALAPSLFRLLSRSFRCHRRRHTFVKSVQSVSQPLLQFDSA